MSFDLSERRLAWLPVEFPTFVSDGDADGRVILNKVTLQVDLVDNEEFLRLFVTPFDDDGTTPLPEATPERLAEWPKIDDQYRAKALVVGWRGVVSGRTPVIFDADNLAKLMKVPNFSLAFFHAYSNAWAGKTKEREKNSDSSDGNGLESPAGHA